MDISVYIHSDPKVDRSFWRVRNLCWNYVGCWPKKKTVVGILVVPPGRSKTGSWNMVLEG